MWKVMGLREKLILEKTMNGRRMMETDERGKVLSEIC
jgi:hypothetical protein